MKLRIFLALMLAGGLAACGNKGEAGGDKGGEKPAEKPAAEMPAEKAAAAPAAAGDPAAEAKQIMNTRCAACHGTEGKGDGAAAANLPVKPRPYQDQEWQNKVTDEHLKKVIVEGGASVGLSPLMAPNPDLKDKPAVVDELVKIVRSYKK
ncbi:MAG: c-type cytochrome [Myxococcales bacterium]|nr:c-type cytochrome [Myxococcales bacterium]